MADAEFDALFDQLVELEKEHPHLVTPDSPTQRVGAEPSARFAAVAHALPMLSLDKCASEEEFVDWEARCRTRVGYEGELEFTCEPKIDGVAVSLIYENGMLVRGANARRRFERRGHYRQRPDRCHGSVALAGRRLSGIA